MDDSLDGISETSLELFQSDPPVVKASARAAYTHAVPDAPQHFHEVAGRWIDGVILRLRSSMGFHPTTAVHATLSRRLRNLSKRVADAPSNIALRIAHSGAVGTLLDRRRARALEAHRPRLPTLSGIDADIVDGLRRDGIFVTTLEALGMPHSGNMLAAAQHVADGFALRARALTRNGSMFNIVPSEAIVNRPGIIAWGLQDRLLDIIEAYIGLPAAYDGPHVAYTVADGREVGTRRWHRDREDERMVKIAIYCNDVDPAGGPFEMIRTSIHDGDTPYPYRSLSDEELTARYGGKAQWNVMSCAGQTGTVIFADTARNYHRGRPAWSQDRKTIFYSYFARKPRHPFCCERSGLSRAQMEAFARKAPGITPRQRDSILWRNALPLIARMIPPARM
jgi:hypothetical protein